MSTTRDEIAALQSEYNQLQEAGVQTFGSKARAQLEKQLRDEMKRRLELLSGNADEFKKRKREIFRQLTEAKQRRRDEIAQELGQGSIDPVDAEAEIIALGWESGVARAMITAAANGAARHVTTQVELAREPNPVTVAQYAEVPTDVIVAMVDGHEDQLKKTNPKAPESRDEAIAMLVRAGLAPEISPVAVETTAQPPVVPTAQPPVIIASGEAQLGNPDGPPAPAAEQTPLETGAQTTEQQGQAEPPAPIEIMDPVGAEQPVSREEIYTETGRDPEPPAPKRKRK
jgi:hypothetical protein